ncbi:MAG: hypothetical protein NT002_13690 [candidate division Zixibacteria bacterium]|nr:hypothetical protein [candidate division Zixibacteria bacterium]
MMTVINELIEALEAAHIRCRVVSVAHVNELRERIEQSRREKILPEPVDRTCFPGIEYEPEKQLPGAKSIIIAAVPSPCIRNRFQWQGEMHTILIPPAYTGGGARVQNLKDRVEKILVPHGYKIANAPIPKKLLAVCSGLGEYGRNNICYVPGMGSFIQLVSLYSDMPCPEDFWREPVMMSSCGDCPACRQNCPTGAIDGDRFAIASDRCLTFFNENSGSFPDWVNPSWFDCLVGCLRCQIICPENAPYLNQIVEGESFTEEETALLLTTPAPEQVSSETRAKLERLDLFYMEIIPRNLKAALGQ